MKKRTSILLVFSLISSFCFSQSSKSTIVFYSAVSDSADSSMIKLTQDLFYSQLSALDAYTVIDKRNEDYTSSNIDNDNDYIFYVEIQQSENNWVCTLNAFSTSNGYHAISTKEYESYYMILLDAKNSLSLVMDNVRHPESMQNNVTVTETDNYEPTNEQNQVIHPTVELLAGTWKGDSTVDKIVILRAGRGFAIFKNGSSMNITVTISGNQVQLKQTSKNNASYYPELPREIALAYAADASPIIWTLNLSSEDTLFGEKTTAQPLYEGTKAVSAQSTVLPVELTKQN